MREVESYYSNYPVTNPTLHVVQCGWEKCRSGHSIGPSVHSEFLIHFVVNGKGKYFSPIGEFSLSKNSGFLIMPGQVTGYCADVDNPWEYFWVGFKGTEAKQLLASAGLTDERLVFTQKEGDKVEECLKNLIAISHDPNLSEYSMIGYLYLFFSQLIAQYRMENRPNTCASIYIEKAVKYIKDSFSYDMSVANLARYLGIDRSYLYKLFITEFGISPEEYIIRCRIFRAAELLQTTNLSVLEVAYSSGFKNVSHFSKMFKKLQGVTPGTFRKRNQNLAEGELENKEQLQKETDQESDVEKR